MSFSKSILTLSILAAASVSSFAAENEQVKTLETIRIKAHPLEQTSQDFAVADTVVDQKTLAQGAVTIGDALANEVGIYSNQFGAGSSRPVIRGQDGARVKVLQNSSENIDVSTLSPDHAVTVDPALASQVEVIRGPSTLLFGAGTVGGLVNVTDNKIPTQMPEKGYEGNVGLRFNTGSDEKLASAGVTVGLGDQVALRVEGLKREANDYIAPNYFHEGEKERRVDNTFAEGQTVNVGLSWIYDRGFTGISYSNRQDKYGLPGHSHEYESCDAHLTGRPHLHCGDHDHGHGGHDDHDHDHDHDHRPGTLDAHLWLSTVNARVIAARMAADLSAADPANAARYEDNLKAFEKRLQALDTRLAARVAGIQGKPYFVFHEAFDYFESAYGLKHTGVFAVAAEVQPGAQHVAAMRQRLQEVGKTCVFSEPPMRPKLAQTLTAGLPVTMAELDALGGFDEATATGYETLLGNLADNLAGCLEKL